MIPAIPADIKRTAVQAAGVNLAASAAFYLLTSDRRHWKAAAAVGLFGAWLWRVNATPKP